MTIGCRISINAAAQVELFDDRCRTQVENVKNRFSEYFIRDSPGAKGNEVNLTDHIGDGQLTAFGIITPIALTMKAGPYSGKNKGRLAAIIC